MAKIGWVGHVLYIASEKIADISRTLLSGRRQSTSHHRLPCYRRLVVQPLNGRKWLHTTGRAMLNNCLNKHRLRRRRSLCNSTQSTGSSIKANFCITTKSLWVLYAPGGIYLRSFSPFSTTFAHIVYRSTFSNSSTLQKSRSMTVRISMLQ